MITTSQFERVYLARGSTDLRKSIDGLAVIVKECFELDPFSPCLFVFCNRKRDKMKILQWEHNGFLLNYIRLERGNFHWLTEIVITPLIISITLRRYLLAGYPIDLQHNSPLF